MKKRLRSCFPAAVAVFTLCSLVSCRELYVDAAERFVRADASVQSRVGEVNSLSRRNTIIVEEGVSATGAISPAYHEYRYIVRGSRSKAFVSVLVTTPADPAKRRFSVKLIEDL